MAEKTKVLGLLTEIEHERLINYDQINAVERKNLNFRLKKKFNIINNAFKDIDIMLNLALKEKSIDEAIKKSIDMETALYSIKVTKSILQLLDPFPIFSDNSGRLTALKTKKVQFPNSRGTAELIYTPTPEEVDLWHAVQDHIDFLRKIYDVENIDQNVYTLKEYKDLMTPAIERLMSKGIEYKSITNPNMQIGNLVREHDVNGAEGN